MKTKPCLTLDDVKKVLAAAEAEATKNNWKVVICVLDDGGHLLGLLRLDGATPTNVEIAMGKGRTAALHGKPSKFWEDLVKDGWLPILGMPFILAMQGGLPIIVKDERIGGIGVSGAHRHQDEQIAQAGINALDG